MQFILELKKLAFVLKQSSQLNLLSNYDDALLAMAELEGEAWLNRQLTASPDDMLTVPNAHKHLLKHQEELADYIKELETETSMKEIEFLENQILESPREILSNGIYGEGGGHRYFLRGDGTVIYSARHGLDDLYEAKRLNFEIMSWP